jgi:hypothetical protein
LTRSGALKRKEFKLLLSRGTMLPKSINGYPALSFTFLKNENLGKSTQNKESHLRRTKENDISRCVKRKYMKISGHQQSVAACHWHQAVELID